MKYIFETVVTMKEYNNKKWWIEPNIVTRKMIEADTIATALERFRALGISLHRLMGEYFNCC